MAQLTSKEHLARHDREIAAIRKLILTGMKMINALTASQQRLAASQRETDKQLQALIRSMQRGSNGHTKRSVSH